MSNFNYTEMSRVVEAPNTFLAECAAGSKSTPCVSDKILDVKQYYNAPMFNATSFYMLS